MADAPRIGDVLLARLPQHVPPGHEQEGVRPIVVVGEPERAGQPRFSLVFAAPITSQLGPWVQTGGDLYPVLKGGVGGLVRDSVVMLDHARGVDPVRVLRRLGQLTEEEYAPMRRGLEMMLEVGNGDDSEAAVI
jgi:mRNA interferase MazF